MRQHLLHVVAILGKANGGGYGKRFGNATERPSVSANCSTNVKAKGDEDIASPAKSRFRSAAEELDLDKTKEPHVYGNPSGLSVLRKLEHFKAEVADKSKEIVSLKHAMSLSDDPSSAGMDIRRRFVEDYERNQSRTRTPAKATQPVNRAIQKGNEVAHSGQAMLDSIVFQHDQREHPETYKLLYRLAFSKVLELRKLLDILNALGTLQANGSTLSQGLNDAFKQVLGEATKSWKKFGDTDPHSPFERARRRFWSEHARNGRTPGTSVRSEQ
ncbi:MAG: hypothetical protein M1832_003272 [Thelocarpon impressellum]|nr:MAG: hypothetical protein M1832_003272 [Thelocarpon impressellum]